MDSMSSLCAHSQPKQSALASRAARRHLRDTKLVILGSPATATPVMAAAPLVALDLPLKVVVWSADDYQTKLSYTAPGALARRFGLSPEHAARLAGIDALTNAVIAR
jgi:uncharacterized protein (DUF302 family)